MSTLIMSPDSVDLADMERPLLRHLTSTQRGHILDTSQPRPEDEEFSIGAVPASLLARPVRDVRPDQALAIFTFYSRYYSCFCTSSSVCPKVVCACAFTHCLSS